MSINYSSLQQVNMKDIDYEILFKIVDGEENLGREVIQMMVNTLPVESERIAQFAAQQNWHQVDYLTHKLCGSAAFCGMTKVKYYAQKLNNSVRHHDLVHISTQLEDLQAAIISALKEAENFRMQPRKAS